MKKPIIVLGEVMLDKYTFGKVERINPEAPVPVLNVTRENKTLGGAGNVANNLKSLEEEVYLISLVGDDENSKVIKNICEEKGIKYFFVFDNRPTIVKHRFVAEGYNQQLLRVDYEIKDLISEDLCDQILSKILEIDSDILIISDYAKGLITPYLMENLKNTFKGKILVDPKPKNIDLYKDVFIIKPNFKETCEILGFEIKNNDQDIEKYGKDLVKKFNSNFVITRSEKGASLITFDNKILHVKPEVKELHDVSGAGDTFIATVAFGLNNGFSLEESVKLANKASSIVVGKFGTSTVSLNELGVNIEKSNIFRS